MKKMLFIWLLSGMFISAATSQYDDALPTGYEGDNFSLEGALDLFKNSHSLDQFERKLNTESNWVNNLDLNYDGRTDYIRVEHRSQGDFHAVVLQALVGSRDVQDVAVIEIEKVSRRDAVLQIIGDEDLFGEEVIVEAYDRNSLVNGNYNSNSRYGGSYVNVYNWAPVQFIFSRRYVRYVSPYNYNYYPTWWSPWNRCGYDVFRPRVRHYATYYRPVRIHRVRNVHNFYRPNRAYSSAVLNRTNKVRTKHGRKAINRPTVNRGKVANTSTGRNRGNVRGTVKGQSDRGSTRGVAKGSTDRGSRATTKNTSKGSGYSKSNSKSNSRGNVAKSPTRSGSKSTVTKKSRTTRAKTSNRGVTKTKSQSRSKSTSQSTRSNKSAVKRSTKKSSGVKKSSSKSKSTSKRTSSKRKQ